LFVLKLFIGSLFALLIYTFVISFTGMLQQNFACTFEHSFLTHFDTSTFALSFGDSQFSVTTCLGGRALALSLAMVLTYRVLKQASVSQMKFKQQFAIIGIKKFIGSQGKL
jgi:hypothetical protein